MCDLENGEQGRGIFKRKYARKYMNVSVGEAVLLFVYFSLKAPYYIGCFRTNAKNLGVWKISGS